MRAKKARVARTMRMRSACSHLVRQRRDESKAETFCHMFVRTLLCLLDGAC